MKRIFTTLSEKWPEYLLEILVLIIGIYGAFALESWNERKRQEQTLKSIYKIIKDDLTMNNGEFTEFINYFETIRKPTFDSILYSSLEASDYQKDRKYYWVFSGFEDLAIHTRGYELLKKQNDQLLLDNLLAADITYFYKESLKEIEVAERELGEEFTDNFKAFKQYDLVTDHLVYGHSEAYYEFIANDPEALNRIRTYEVLFFIYVNELKQFNAQSQKLIAEIDKQLD